MPDTQLDVVLDGPYGGLERRGVERAFDGVVLVAGGAGITVCLPWVQDLVRRMRDGGGEGGGAMTKRVSLLWMIRQTEHFAWAEHELRAARDEGRGRFEATVYVTGARRTEKAGKAAASEDGEKEMGGPGELKRAASGDLHGGAVTVHAHRPNIGDLLPKVVTLPRTLVIGTSAFSFPSLSLPILPNRRHRRAASGQFCGLFLSPGPSMPSPSLTNFTSLAPHITLVRPARTFANREPAVSLRLRVAEHGRRERVRAAAGPGPFRRGPGGGAVDGEVRVVAECDLRAVGRRWGQER